MMPQLHAFTLLPSFNTQAIATGVIPEQGSLLAQQPALLHVVFVLVTFRTNCIQLVPNQPLPYRSCCPH